MNQDNNYGFEPMMGQPMQNQNTTNIYSQQAVQQNFNTYAQPVEPQQPKKKFNAKFIIIIVVAIAAIIAGIVFAPKLLSDNEKKANSPVEVLSTFEQKDGYYVLQDENGNILLDNIKSHGKFCNGTTEVQNTNGEYGIIDGSGKFISEYGKYDMVDQYSSWGGNYYCFYEVIDSSSQKHILKYDGSTLYSNGEDKYLSDVNIHLYDVSTRFVLFETENDYQFLNYMGDAFFTVSKDKDSDEPIVMQNNGNQANEKYLTIYSNGKTYIYDLKTFKPAFNSFEGKYWIKDIEVAKITTNIAGIESIKEEDSLIIFGYPNPDDESKRKTILAEKGKITFETDKCLNVAFVDGNNLRCLIQNGGVFEYYDIKGNKLDK